MRKYSKVVAQRECMREFSVCKQNRSGCCQSMLSYCHKILLSTLKTLRSFLSYFACSRYIESLVHLLPRRGEQQIPLIHHKKYRSMELPSLCLTAQDCVDTCVWAATL